jgi:hypothetical protein
MPKARVLKKYRGGGGSNELEDLVFRLSLELPIHESENIVNKLGVTDMTSFKNKTAKYGLINVPHSGKIIDIQENITMEGDANKILSVILDMREKIKEDEQILFHNLDTTFEGYGINRNHNTSYIYNIIRILRLNNLYDLIDVTPKDIKDIQELPQIYKEKLLALRKDLKTNNKIYTFLMKNKILTQHEAIHVYKEFGILNPDDLHFFSQNEINSIKKLKKEKKDKLLILIRDINKKISPSSS